MTNSGGPAPRGDRHRTIRYVSFVLAELVGAATILAGVLTENRALLGVGAVLLLAAAGLGVVNYLRDAERR